MNVSPPQYRGSTVSFGWPFFCAFFHRKKLQKEQNTDLIFLACSARNTEKTSTRLNKNSPGGRGLVFFCILCIKNYSKWLKSLSSDMSLGYENIFVRKKRTIVRNKRSVCVCLSTHVDICQHVHKWYYLLHLQ